MNLRTMFVREEGVRFEAYPDPLTNGDPWTIGIGHTGPEVHKGLVWTSAQVDAAFEADMEKARKACDEAFPWFDKLNDARQAVLIGMAFQMGITGLLKFKNTLAAIRDEHFALANTLMLQSLWAKQTPQRAQRMARQIETGAWQ
jgi:lysozyme